LAAYYARFDHPTDAAFISDDILTSLKERRIGEIVENYISCRGGIRVVVLDPNLVKELGDVLLRMQGDMPTFERAFCQKISARHREILDVIRTKGILPIAILCETDLKVVVKALLKACGQQQAVLAFSDVSSRFAVEEIGLLGA